MGNEKKTILIVDDQEINRVILKELFKDEYNIIEAGNGEEALNIINSDNTLSAVMLDIVMPVMDGMSVLMELNRSGKIYHIPVFIITAADNMQMITSAFDLGAVDIVSKPFRMCFIKSRINNTIELYRYRNEFSESVSEAVSVSQKRNNKMVEFLSGLIEFRNCESGEHIKRIRKVTKRLLTKLGELYPEYYLEKKAINRIGKASVFHDLGMIAVRDDILRKQDSLTEEELEELKAHAEGGCAILAEIPDGILDEEVYRYSNDICRYHHERWDGSGYPEGLKGDETPIWAQVVAIADIFDELTSPRGVSKPTYDYDTAVKMINNSDCGQINPKLLEAFNAIIDDIIEVHRGNL